eukprot:14030661-Alexandrium_andersonii.AAC.1
MHAHHGPDPDASPRAQPTEVVTEQHGHALVQRVGARACAWASVRVRAGARVCPCLRTHALL